MIPQDFYENVPELRRAVDECLKAMDTLVPVRVEGRSGEAKILVNLRSESAPKWKGAGTVTIDITLDGLFTTDGGARPPICNFDHFIRRMGVERIEDVPNLVCMVDGKETARAPFKETFHKLTKKGFEEALTKVKKDALKFAEGQDVIMKILEDCRRIPIKFQKIVKALDENAFVRARKADGRRTEGVHVSSRLVNAKMHHYIGIFLKGNSDILM
ncbi:hypothetical protein LCGC14_2568230, partial [marine sediment metagenome]